MSRSGTKLSVVPRRLGAAPTSASGVVATPREKVWRYSFLSRATSTTVSIDSALTTLTPTPWSPPEVE